MPVLIYHLIAFLVLGSLTYAPVVSARVKVDQSVPDFELQDSFGETHKLSDFLGKHVVLEWSNHLCPFVQKHYNSDNMQSLQKTYTEKGIVWLTIISSKPGKQGHISGAKANELTEGRNAHPSYVLFDPDGSVGKTYGARTTPHIYIIDPKGILRYMGAIDSIASADISDIEQATNYVVSHLEALLANQTATPKVTRPYGCSVKY